MAAIWLWCMPISFAAPTSVALENVKMNFHYQELGGDYQRYACEHKPDTPFDWIVSCDLNGKMHTYSVHFSIRFYAGSQYGAGAYEVLYWITDRTHPQRKFDSSTIWIHNDSAKTRMNVMTLNQGIEEDLAYLQLFLDLRQVIR